MIKKTAAIALLLSCQFSSTLLAQTVKPADVETLFNFAEQAAPSLFSPSGQTTLATVSDWLHRFYPGSQSYAAVHLGTGGEFIQGGVYTLGGPFGDEVVFIDTLPNLITQIGNSNPPGSGVSGITNAGNGNCVDMTLPAVGVVANYRQTSGNGALSSITDFSQEYIQVGETMFELESIANSNVGGLTSTTVTRSVSEFEIVDDLRYVVSIDSQVTSTVEGFDDTKQRILVSYAANLFQGPARRLCEGQEWFAAPVEQTLTMYTNGASEPSSMSSSETSPQSAAVESISDAITVPAGSFSAVRTRFTFPGIVNVIWSDPETGLLLRNENIDRDNGQITILTELQSLQ